MPTTLAIPDDAAHRPLTLRLPLSDEQFLAFCQINRDLRIERTAEKDIIVMAPAGGSTGHRNSKLTTRLQVGTEKNDTGFAFDSSTGFDLPGGSTRSPDAAWVLKERLAKLTSEQKEKFLPLCPDFAVELCSPSDRPVDVQDKMEEYLAGGLRLGWLLDPQTETAYGYRPDAPVETLEQPEQLSGDPVLPGFTLALDPIWNPDL